MDFKNLCLSFVIVCGLGVGLQIFLFSPISPQLQYFPQLSPSATISFQSNSKLQEVSLLGEGNLVKPEDVAVDKNGVLYTATRDGWIKRMQKNGTWENWKWMDTPNMFGITTSADGGLYVCESKKGVIKFTEEGTSVVVSELNGQKIGFVNDVIEAWDRSLYFSVPSTKFDVHTWMLDMLEAKPHGQVLKFDPTLNQTSIVLENLGFANGVALSANQDFLIVCETWKFRCLKYWLKTENKGKTEIFIDNLPGEPDNINLAPDGTFWIAIIEVIPRSSYIHKSKVLKHMLATFSWLVQHFIINGASRKAMVVNVDTDGKIIKFFDDPTGKKMSFVTSALEFEDHLYLGTLNSNYIGKLALRDA